MRNRYYKIWVGCGTFSVVVSVLLMVLTILIRLVLLRVCIRSNYSRVSDVCRIAQRSNENSRVKCTQTWVHCVKLDLDEFWSWFRIFLRSYELVMNF